MVRSEETVLSGTVIYGDDFDIVQGYVCLKDGIIKEVGEGRVDCDLEGIICPRFINAHTHLGDSVAKDPPFMDLRSLVGPGGFKHRVLARTARSRLVEGMRRSVLDMISTGTFGFLDFREGGPEGTRMLLESIQGLDVVCSIMGRPDQGSTEIDDRCFGLGMSSTRDMPFDLAWEYVNYARSLGKGFAVHAGEAGKDDIEGALSLYPDFLIHMNKADRSDLEKVARMEIPVVVCPRSNLFTGVGLPDIGSMMDLGITVAVGTDNVMLNSVNILEEMALISKYILHDDRQVFKMCTLNGAKIAGIEKKTGSILEGKEGRVMVIDGSSNNMWGSTDPLASIVRRARPSDILAVF
jgi:cytosine/adenosine deaminase-related metal-dependent hydrolase